MLQHAPELPEHIKEYYKEVNRRVKEHMVKIIEAIK